MTFFKYLGWAILIAVGLIITAPVLYFGSGFVYQMWNTSTYRYRLTLDVEADGKVHTGSSVVQVKVTEKANWLPQTDGSLFNLTGEAVVVDLGKGRYLFSLLKHPVRESRIYSLPGVALKAAGRKVPKGGMVSAGKLPLPFEQLPLLVTFGDINKPETVKRVMPDDLAAAFGEGVRLKSATVEMTYDPVTHGNVEKVLGWLKRLKGGYLHGGFTSRGSPMGLHGGDFKIGD